MSKKPMGKEASKICSGCLVSIIIRSKSSRRPCCVATFSASIPTVISLQMSMLTIRSGGHGIDTPSGISMPLRKSSDGIIEIGKFLEDSGTIPVGDLLLTLGGDFGV